jgi:N6-adenosine-specific RNA methylase IME4
MSDSLATIEKARLTLRNLRADLMNAKTFDQVKHLGDMAATLKDVLRRMKADLALSNEAAELWIRARRRAGEMVDDGQKTGNLQRPGGDRKSMLHDETLIPPTLDEIGISRIQSHRWQMLADVDPAIFEKALEDILSRAEDDDDQLTMALLQFVINQLQHKEVGHPVVPAGQYSTLVVDPPWEMQKISRIKYDLQAGFDYPTLSIDQLKEYPIKGLAADSAHLYLWTTHKHLPFAFELAEAWGFAYECLMTWVKNVGFTPYSWMRSTEHVLFCKRGGLPLSELGLRLDFKADRRKHSRKPDEFYELVKRVSPEPRIDIFSREPRDGFEQAGNQIDQFKVASDGVELQGQ